MTSGVKQSTVKAADGDAITGLVHGQSTTGAPGTRSVRDRDNAQGTGSATLVAGSMLLPLL